MPKIPPKVDDHDLLNLCESGLMDTTIRANGLHTKGDALVFPYRNLDGKANGFVRIRPHTPREINGKQVKYEHPKGMLPRAYFPVASLAMIRNGESPLYVTEGEKKAIALSQLDLAAISISGVWCWKVKDNDELIPDLAGVNWNDQDVYIVFDYDRKADTRRQVDLARRRFAKALRVAGVKEVYNVELPSSRNGKQGVDDFLTVHDASAFYELVRAAKPVPTCTRLLRIEAGRTDSSNGVRLIDRFANDVRWIGTWDKWLIWDSQRWKVDQELRIEAYAKQVANHLWKELTAEFQNAIGKDVPAMYAFAKRSNNAHGIRAMVALARSEPGVAIGQHELDADPWLLNVENGTLDLRTGELREHRRTDFLTKLAPVEFDPAARCPLWQKFLRRILADNEELIRYLQRLFGYNLTGVTEEHILPFLWGNGANGKTTLCETKLKLLGSDYAMKATPDLLMVRRGESHPTDRADLFGKRFVACVETEEGRRMAESLVKELTGGDRVRARRMREDFWEFTPTHHVWLAGNHKPTIIGTDLGIWRRIKLIPFEVTIPQSEQDKRLPAKLADELPGILNWALEGCLDWQQNGMQEPAIVQMATQEYSTEMDDIGQFIEENCQLGQQYIAPATELYLAFKNKMPTSGISQKVFGAYLARNGYTKGRTNKGKHGWRGLRLLSDATRAAVTEKIMAKQKKRKERRSCH